ncbi:MAG: hypothetical protein D6797_07435 [Bdellovibrio sp.]|nr:MAG: hypothetical protein D6797_07435 [Bdellovibrio sp.]
MKNTIFLFIVFAVFGVLAEEQEGFLNKLLAPGPLIEGHKKLEKTGCLECHSASKGVVNSKCLKCHKEIKKYVDLKKGLHGRTNKDCKECHSDHKGRKFDSTKVDKKTFDHSITGFRLKGKHGKIKCIKCHTQKRTKKFIRPHDIRFFGSSTSCKSCHKKDDLHFFVGKWKKKDCGDCHNELSWRKNTRFDHFKETNYRLIGKHAKLRCKDCHKVDKRRKWARYTWPHLKQSKCLSCHKDVHGNRLSSKFRNGQCQKCHLQTTWKIKKFNHKVTGYPLRGKHAKLQCIKCHKQQRSVLRKRKMVLYKWIGLSKDCLKCHKDYHRYGSLKLKKYGSLHNCLQCHTEENWKKTHDFDHQRDAGYPIEGKHKKLKCSKCHLKKVRRRVFRSVYHWEKLKQKTCETCHKSPHKRSFSKKFLSKKCSECHTPRGWKEQKNFDHKKTRFPLTGKHAKLRCNQCHIRRKKQVFKFKHFEEKFCIDCHKNEHKKQFSKKFSSRSCSECHTTRDFVALKKFNHSETGFKLRGKHAKIKCVACHKKTRKRFRQKPRHYKGIFIFKDLERKQCTLCHIDVHKKQLGNDCLKCHNESNWKKRHFNHNKDSDFPLRGAHRKTKCSKCHKAQRHVFVIYKKRKLRVIKFKPLPKVCAECHKDPHKGEFGKECKSCHLERSWKYTKDFHRNFTLHGVHYTVGCAECHVDDRNLGGLSQECILCHQKDDVHSGSLPNCGECHKQSFWESTSFRHSMTNFPLRGSHRTLDCFQCHSRGIYEGVGSDCIDCHEADRQQADAVANPPHPLPAFEDCKSCHNQWMFK